MRGKRALVKTLTGLALASSLYGLPVKKANALDIIMPSGIIIEVPDETTQQSNLQQPQKTKSEFTPPELPYCRIIRADGQGVVIDYYPKDYNRKHKAYTLRWVVDNISRYSTGGLYINYIYTAGYNVELKAQDKAFITDCLIRASRKVMDNTGGGAGGYTQDMLRIEEIDGNIFDSPGLYFSPANY